MSAAAMLSSAALFLFLILPFTTAAPYTGYGDREYAPNVMMRDGDKANIQFYRQPVIRDPGSPVHNYQPHSQSFHLPTQVEIQSQYQPREPRILPYYQPRQPQIQSYYQPRQPEVQLHHQLEQPQIQYYQPRQPQIQYHQPGQSQIQSYHQPGQPQIQSYYQPGQSLVQYHKQPQPQPLIQNYKQPYSSQPSNPLPVLQSIPTEQEVSQSSLSHKESQTIQALVNELRSLATLESKPDRNPPPTDPTVLSLPPIQVISEGNDGEMLAIASLNGAGYVAGGGSSASGNRDQVMQAAVNSLSDGNRGAGVSSSGKATVQMDLDIGISSDNTKSNSKGGLHMDIPMPDTNEKNSILHYLRRSLPSSTQRNGMYDYVKNLLDSGGKVAISSIADEQTGEATAQMKIDINAKQGNTKTTYSNKNAGGLHMHIPLPDASEKQNIMHYLQKALTSVFSSSANTGTTSGSVGR